ncbi:hypothetical protein H5410_022949 [Solanum commersonii]|uniref:Uncharacterized protein n=1 Tax=Solanum commersonii TaxID=4109 RepID=A0A9J5ZIX6_SOLCO|nr:hypothetical protein H5410_022949 [Solanum commersonii]
MGIKLADVTNQDMSEWFGKHFKVVTTRMTDVNKRKNCLSIEEGVYEHCKEKLYKILRGLYYKWWTISFVIKSTT